MIDALSIIVCLAASHMQAAMAFSTKQNRCQSRLAVRLIHSSRLPEASASDGRPESKKGLSPTSRRRQPPNPGAKGLDGDPLPLANKSCDDLCKHRALNKQ
jgi:hypothetical protein